ncbi:hypothetical protein Tco_0351526 [Tanacetum coccineum]
MSITKEQQQALDDALVPREQRLTIGSCNYRLSTTFKPKEPTFQVALDFIDPPFEEGILSFMRELGYPGNIKLLFDVKVDTLPQPWRIFGTIINKCLSGKVTGIDTLRLSRAQILWRLYHQETVDYIYLLWEDLVFQIENKETRKNKYMFYPIFTKVIINHFMPQDKSISRRNKVDLHMANDDPILTTMRFIPQYEVVQRYGAILPDYLTNLTMKASEAYKTYHDLATGKVQPKPKYVRRSSRLQAEQVPKPSTGKRVKTTAKVAKSGKKKQPTSGLETLSYIALTEAEQLKLATKRSLIQTHTWKSSDEEDDDDNDQADDDNDVQSDDDINQGQDDQDNDDDEHTESDNDGEDFVHPKLITHDDEARQDDEVNKEDSFDPRVQTPSRVESISDEDNDDEIQGGNVQGTKIDKEATNEEEAGNELYRDVNVNLAGQETEMTDAPQTNVQTTQVIKDSHVTSLVDVPVTTIVETSFLVTIILPLPPNPLITQVQQTPAPTPTNVPSSSLQDLPNFGSLQQFNYSLKDLEKKLKPKTKNSSIRSMPLVNDQLESEVLIRSSKEANTSHVVAANLSEVELKKILIDKMEANKSIDSRKYATSVTKTKAADYGHIKWIKDLVPNTMWSPVLVDYDKHALWGISHWGRKRQQFYGFAVNRESARDVYSKRRIIAVTKLEIVEWQNYKHLDWITVRRDDDKLYKFKEGDLKRLRIQDIKDMLLLLVQGKLTNLTVEERLAFNVSLRMFTRSIVIQRRVEDLQLGVKSYQKKLNLTKPDTYRSDLKRRDAYSAYSTPRGFIYQNKDKKNRLMRIDELHKFSDGTLDDVRIALNARLKGIQMQYCHNHLETT